MNYLLFKRIFDIVFALLFFVLLSPIYLITAVVIYLGDFHNPFYKHLRVGKNRKQFDFYKFRSMVANADDILFKDPEFLKKMRSGTNKVIDDPRITKFGRFIRKYSIDEFPQMLNVIKGDMSVIGPRALRPDEFAGYESLSSENKQKLDLLATVKPGISGYWQVNGRSNVDFERRMELECYYARNISFKLDFEIILKTPMTMIKGEGAY